MVAKKVFVGFSITVFVFGIGLFFFAEKFKTPESKPEIVTSDNINKPQKISKPQEKKYDLYQNNMYDLPLYSIAEISKLTPVVKKKVDELLESSLGFYFLRIVDDSVFIILKNPVKQGNVYHRHDLQFVEISSDGRVSYHDAGYTGQEGEIFNAEFESESDNWYFDKNQEGYPIKHIAYDENGDVKYTEKWNYGFDEKKKESVKYEMKNSQNKVVSLLKEIYTDENHYRKEHVFYDNDGNILMSLSINYEGADINRLTFYNSHDSIDSVSILTEFENGLKTKELIYNQDYELNYIVDSTYVDDLRKEIRVSKADGVEIIKIRS